MFRLVDGDWAKQISKAMGPAPSRVRIICPFIKYGAARDLFGRCKPSAMQVITRFDLKDFARGVSDIAALQFMLKMGAEVRGIKQLHSKMYLFDSRNAVVTSANLTRAALTSNHEVGFVIEGLQMVETCHLYFERLWQSAGSNVLDERLCDWQHRLDDYLIKNPAAANRAALPDFGATSEAGFSLTQLPVAVSDAPQAFVKFLGSTDNREPLGYRVIDEIARGRCHRAVAYPASKRPRSVQDGAVMYFGRLTRDENDNDIRIFGRGIGLKYVEGRDDATDAEKQERSWLKKWSRYIRIHNAEYINGTMKDAVSLGSLMSELGSDAFASTKRNAAKGEGNLNPRKSFMQQPSVELSAEGKAWLDRQLEAAFSRHGILPPEDYEHIA